LSRRQDAGKQSFVLEIDGRPVLAFNSRSVERAKLLFSQAWLLEDLGSYRSGGNPIWDGEAKLSVRHADDRESLELEVALRGEQARKEYEGHVFAFLVPLDPALQ
jgi:hypothetical protein